MMRWVVLACAAFLAVPLAAQSVRSRLEGRIPSEAIAAVDSLVQFASQEGLPTEPLIQKALEGGAKHVAGPRIVAAVQVTLGQLRGARDLLVRAGDQLPLLLPMARVPVEFAAMVLLRKSTSTAEVP